MLFVSGQLKEDRGGPGFKADISADYGFTHTDARRSVYVPVFRNALPEIFDVFDFADPSMVTGTRNSSTVAPQALFLMNHPFVRQQAQAAAHHLLAAKLNDDDARLLRAYRMTLGRSPSPGEIAVSKKLLDAEADAMTAWTDLFHAIFASGDFRYVN